MYACVHVRVCVHFLCLCVLCVRDLTVGFPFYSVYAFFFGALVKRLLLLLASNFALSVPALPFANPIHEREFIGQGR